MIEKRSMRLLTVAVLGLALAAGGCSKKEEHPAEKAKDSKAFFSAVPFGGGEIVHEKVNVGGEMVEIAHSKLDMGPPENMFDNDPKTLVRTEKANPAVFDLDFPTPRAMKGISVTTASMDIGLTAKVTSAGSAGQKVYSKEFRSLPADPTVRIDFDARTGPVQKLRIEITKLDGTDGHIHIREIHFN
jgi:hypothetical protein